MKLLKLLLIFCITTAAYASNQQTSAPLENMVLVENNECGELPDKDTLIGGWYSWAPYQFSEARAGGSKLVGMDIWLVKYLASKVKVDIMYQEISWGQHQLDLIKGDRDIASGATYTADRAKYAYFSIPYRYEEDSIFTLRDSAKKLNFANIKEFLAQVRLQNFRLGVVDGFVYAAPEINDFIQDNTNRDIIVKYAQDLLSLKGLVGEEVDGFIADRVVGATIISNNGLDQKVEEVPLNVKTPIHLMFSKKTVPVEVVEKFNNAITMFVDSDEYKRIISTYLYSLLLLQTINADWFYIVGVIGTIAFALSGVAIAAKENATLLGTMIFAMLPSVAGGMMRDILINRDKINILTNPSYIYIIIVIVIIGFATIQLLESYNRDAQTDSSLTKFWNNLLVICDSLGQASFIVTGVAIAMMARIDPIALWGPFFAFITANGGGILRDIIKKDRAIDCIHGDINAEISIIWGLFFSLFLSLDAYDPDPDKINYMVTFTVFGAFATRLLAHYFKIPNLRFRKEIITATPEVIPAAIIEEKKE